MSNRNSSKILEPIGKESLLLPTLEVARSLLGVTLCRRFENGHTVSGEIVEVEAYTEDDPACHAYKGLTARTKPLFGKPGTAYVYFIYGMYHCFNVVTEPSKQAGAVLIRAVAAEGADGPGKLCREWRIDKSHNEIDLTTNSSPIWLAKGRAVPESLVERTPRIGISVAKERLWRFIIKDHPSLSGPKRRTSKSKTKSRQQAK